MRYYIPPKENESDAEFWARMAQMAKMAEGAEECEAAEPRCQRSHSIATPVLGSTTTSAPVLVEHWH